MTREMEMELAALKTWNEDFEDLTAVELATAATAICEVCGHPFTPDSWAKRHAPHEPGCAQYGKGDCQKPDGADDCDCPRWPVHAECCPECTTAEHNQEQARVNRVDPSTFQVIEHGIEVCVCAVLAQAQRIADALNGGAEWHA